MPAGEVLGAVALPSVRTRAALVSNVSAPMPTSPLTSMRNALSAPVGYRSMPSAEQLTIWTRRRTGSSIGR